VLAWGFVVLSAGESGVRAQPSAEFSFPFPFPFTALLQEGALLSSIPESVLFCQSWAAPKHPLGRLFLPRVHGLQVGTRARTVVPGSGQCCAWYRGSTVQRQQLQVPGNTTLLGLGPTVWDKSGLMLLCCAGSVCGAGQGVLQAGTVAAPKEHSGLVFPCLSLQQLLCKLSPPVPHVESGVAQCCRGRAALAVPFGHLFPQI